MNACSSVAPSIVATIAGADANGHPPPIRTAPSTTIQPGQASVACNNTPLVGAKEFQWVEPVVLFFP